MEASSCVYAVVITATISDSALIYIWVIKQIDSEETYKKNILL